jgi:hypothetical protein
MENKLDPSRNLGHRSKSTEAALTKNPAGRVVDYTNNDVGKGIVRGPARGQSVYGKFRDPKDGHDFAGWASYAREGSYTGHGNKEGPGKEPTVREERRSVPSAARNKDSDGYLESTKNWPSFDTGGADSGVGRLEKARKY